jgi:hypothetical protein
VEVESVAWGDDELGLVSEVVDKPRVDMGEN